VQQLVKKDIVLAVNVRRWKYSIVPWIEDGALWDRADDQGIGGISCEFLGPEPFVSPYYLV